jgi:rhodanese-related sulfurtransferase
LIPLGQLVGRANELPADQPLVVYCQGGGRSARAVAALRGFGFEAHNLTGGYRAWKS